MIGGELGLVELARGLGGLGHGRHGQLVRGEVVQVGQLSHEGTLSLLSEPLGINPPLVIIHILGRFVVQDIIIDLAVDQDRLPPLNQNVSITCDTVTIIGPAKMACIYYFKSRSEHLNI